MQQQPEPRGTVVWLDPGGTTGVAAWYFERQLFRSWQEDFLHTGQLIEHIAREAERPIRLGYEQFTITPGRQIKHDGSALMVIGMARWLTLMHDFGMLPSQPPSARRLGLKHLKTVGWYRAGQQHGMDAAGHLMTWMLAGNLLPEELKERIRGGSSGA